MMIYISKGVLALEGSHPKNDQIQNQIQGYFSLFMAVISERKNPSAIQKWLAPPILIYLVNKELFRPLKWVKTILAYTLCLGGYNDIAAIIDHY